MTDRGLQSHFLETDSEMEISKRMTEVKIKFLTPVRERRGTGNAQIWN